MMEDLKAVFTKEYIAKLERLSIGLTERLGAVGYSGGRKSSAKGSSLEFSDFREYIPGDDLRRVDWNGYGRFDKLYLKLFLEEKQAAVNLFLDTSKSMDFGGKIVMAKALAASLAYIAAGGGDRTQIFAFGEKAGAQKLGITKKGQLAETLDFLDGLEPGGGTDYLRAIRERSGLGRGVSIILSDFLSEQAPWDAVKLLQEKKQEVYLLRILTPEEIEPQRGGMVRLVDSETGEMRDLELSDHAVSAYKQALRQQESALREFCWQRGAGYCRTDTETSLLTVLEQLLNG
jgi:uncharacterized protein (DUF58 family)